MVEDWQLWCEDLTESSWLTGRSASLGSRFSLQWSQSVPSPLRGGEIILIQDHHAIRVLGQKTVYETVLGAGKNSMEGDSQHYESVEGACEVYKLAWSSGWGPLKSEACLSVAADGQGTWVEFLVSWRGLGTWRIDRHLENCANMQRRWLAGLQENMERIGTIG